MKKLNILVDMDGVLVDLLPRWLATYGVATGEYIHPDLVTSYDFQSYVRDVEAFDDCLKFALQFAPPVPGSHKAMQELVGAGHNVYPLTYCHPAAPDAHRLKVEWLKHWLPMVDTDKLIATRHKHLVRGDVFIDDSEENIDKWLGAGGARAFLFNAPYNPMHRSFDWHQICRAIRLELEPASQDAVVDALTQMAQEDGMFDWDFNNDI